MHDETVHPLVPKLAGKKQLPSRVAGGVHEQDVVVAGQQRAADADAEQLLPQILQRAEEQPHRAGPAAGQGTGNAIDLVSELSRGPAHPLLRLLGGLNTPQGIRDGGR